MAKLIVQNGTLNVGDIVLCGSSYGRVKAMYDTLKPKRKVKAAGPSMPVNVSGFDEVPGGRRAVLRAGRHLSGPRDRRTADEPRVAGSRLPAAPTQVSFEEFQRRLAEGNLAEARDIVTLNLIVRADVRGSIEAIEKELTKLDHPEVQIRILHKAVGAITAADVMLAHASQAVIIGFNVIPDEAARSLADEKQVEIRRYDVIYKVTDDIQGNAGRQTQARENGRRTGTCAGQTGLPDQPRGGGRRLLRRRVVRSHAVAASASTATVGRSAITRWIRCGTRKTTSRKFPAAWSAA